MRLAYSTFYGLSERHVEGPGFAVRTLRADPNRIVTKHVHEGAHIIAILSGSYLSLASPGARLGATDIVFNPHGVEHADTFDGDDGSFIAVSLDPTVYPALKNDRPAPFTLKRPCAIASIIRIFRQLTSPESVDLVDMEASVIALADVGGDFDSMPTKSDAPRWARNAHRKLSSGQSSVFVSHLAADQGMHPVAFARAFRRHFGASPSRFGLDFRLGQAAQDLARSRDSIADVGLRWGFFDQAHFSRHFRKRFGATPGEFRRIYLS